LTKMLPSSKTSITKYLNSQTCSRSPNKREKTLKNTMLKKLRISNLKWGIWTCIKKTCWLKSMKSKLRIYS
jgi:hypothetical protein